MKLLLPFERAKRKILVKKEADTSPDYGCDPEKRPVETLLDLGISYQGDRFALDWAQIGKTVVLAVILFLFVYLCEHLLESIFIVDFRFIFPFASDLTLYRALMFLLYLVKAQVRLL